MGYTNGASGRNACETAVCNPADVADITKRTSEVCEMFSSLSDEQVAKVRTLIEDVTRFYAQRLDRVGILRLIYIVGLLRDVPHVWIASKGDEQGWSAPLDLDDSDTSTISAWIQSIRCGQEKGVERDVRLCMTRCVDGVIRVWAKTARTIAEAPAEPRYRTALHLESSSCELAQLAAFVLDLFRGMLVDLPHVWVTDGRRHRVTLVQHGTKDEVAKSVVAIAEAIRADHESLSKTSGGTQHHYVVMSMTHEPDGRLGVGYKVA